MSSVYQPLVLVFGGTGHTAVQIINAFAKTTAFRIAAAVRPSSLSKPVIAEYRREGVDIREADIDDSVEKLAKVLSGVDILISTITAEKVPNQRILFAAAKQAGVKRVVPCDFGTPGAKGVRALHDEKLAIREYIQSIGLGYTFINIGWWMQISLPFSLTSKSPIIAISRELYDGGSKKMLVTNLENVGKYVVRVIADERTLNHSVIIWEDEVTGWEAKEIGAKVSGEGAALMETIVQVSAKEILQRASASKEDFARTQSFPSRMAWAWNEYQYSIHVLGENSLENAKVLGYLDFRQLYPDIAPNTLEEYARSFYSDEEFIY